MGAEDTILMLKAEITSLAEAGLLTPEIVEKSSSKLDDPSKPMPKRLKHACKLGLIAEMPSGAPLITSRTLGVLIRGLGDRDIEIRNACAEAIGSVASTYCGTDLLKDIHARDALLSGLEAQFLSWKGFSTAYALSTIAASEPGIEYLKSIDLLNFLLNTLSRSTEHGQACIKALCDINSSASGHAFLAEQDVMASLEQGLNGETGAQNRANYASAIGDLCGSVKGLFLLKDQTIFALLEGLRDTQHSSGAARWDPTKNTGIACANALIAIASNAEGLMRLQETNALEQIDLLSKSDDERIKIAVTLARAGLTKAFAAPTPPVSARNSSAIGPAPLTRT